VTTPDWLLPAASAAAVLYLLLTYAVGGPLVLVRTIVALLSRRRQRYRPVDDDVIANSRFTIPVSVLLSTSGEPASVDAVEALLDFEYPEIEVIVINDGSPGVIEALRTRYGLKAYEVFFRRTLKTSPVRAIYRSDTDRRLLVVDCLADTEGDALNCGVNLARFRYVCCADVQARYRRESLLHAMLPAVEDPANVAGVTTVLGAALGDRGDDGLGGTGATLQRLSSLRKLLARTAGRRLGLSEDGAPGFTVWRRDAIVEAGGFATDVDAVHLEMTFRVHRHMRRRGQGYRMVHVNEPVGSPAMAPSLMALLHRKHRAQRSAARMLWRYRGMIGNPRYGALGVVDLPRYLFATTVVPWIELVALVALPVAVAMGVLTVVQLLLVLAAVALGNAVLLGAGLLLTPAPEHEGIRLRMLALAPFEVFMARPLQLFSRVADVLGVARPEA
jgi:poly-beta-1,6-N-acetyl-D-glucosamine synthase